MRKLLSVIILLTLMSTSYAGDSVTVNTSIHYQTIKGWGGEGGQNTQYEGTPPYLINQIIDESVNDLGLTGLRYESWQGLSSLSYGQQYTWEWMNDNGSPDTLVPSALDTLEIDYYMKNLFVPWRNKVVANGDSFNFYFSPSWYIGGSTGDIPAWLRYSPGEYAEYYISNLNYLKNKYGLVANYATMCNEAGNGNVFTPQLVGTMIKTVAPRMLAAGLPTTIQFPECVNAQQSWQYIQAEESDSTIWPYITNLSYHLYGTNDPYRYMIDTFAKARGLVTSQREYIGLGIDLLYQDLTLGGVSYWDFYGNSDYMPLNTNQTWFTYGAKYWTTRQVLHYNRPGSVRVSAATNDTALHILAFTNNNTTTLCIINDNTGSTNHSVLVKGMVPGTYGYSETSGSGTHTELGTLTVTADSTVTVAVNANMVVALYPHPVNLPPLAISYAASPTFLDLPADSVALSASAQDPELSTVSYLWTVDSFPAGASVVLSSPNTANTNATGMTVAGDYVFNVAISDTNNNTTNKQVTVMVFPGNQPPIISALQSRIPTIVTLPIDTTILQGFCYDLEGDALTYQWSIVSQPAGASALLVTPTAANRCTVRNMTKAGDYVFKYAVSDPTHTLSRDITVPVYPLNDTPVIHSTSATPYTVTSGSGVSILSAVTSDPDSDIITHWWTATTTPLGANPVFSWQGERTTEVSGMTEPGLYVFTLWVIDRTLYATKTDSVYVISGSCPTLDVVTSDATCGQSNGTATAHLTAGSGTYTYAWSILASDTMATARNLAAGTYTVTVIGSGCVMIASGNVSNAGGPVIAVESQLGPTCVADSNGYIHIEASGGTGRLTYAWSNGQSDSIANDLASGVYTVTVEDSNHCQTILTDSLSGPAPISVTITQSGATITAHVSGGTPPYTYQWTTGSTDSSQSSAPKGLDSVVVTDHNGCSALAYFTASSVADIAAGINSFAVYPNPSDGLFTTSIQMANPTDIIISVTDLSGRKIEESAVRAAKDISKPLDLRDHAKGTYIVTLKTKQGSASQRVVIE